MAGSTQPVHKKQVLANKTVPSQLYTKEYYTTCCDGHDEFNRSMGQQLPRRLMEPLKLLNAEPNSMILDIGCGRGELIYHLAQGGHIAIGLDYAAQGIKIARQVLNRIGADKITLGLSQTNAKHLPFPANSIDHVFLLDVIEHLFEYELNIVFGEIYRVLKPGGNLIIHTMPNTWYYAVGYPLYRLSQWLRGAKLPSNPRDRWAYSELHVNEQNPIRMFKSLKKANFAAKIWLKSTQDYTYEHNRFVRFGMRFLTSVHPFKLVFCNDIFAVATKPTQPTR